MVRVVELPQSKKCLCHQCRATLEYEYSDIRSAWESDYGGGKDLVNRIVCPNCQASVPVECWNRS